jgi:Ca2+/Na+ antiporter
MAPSKTIFDRAIQQLESYMHHHSNDEDASTMDAEGPSENSGDADDHVDLIEFPSEGTNAEVFLWIFLSPLRFAMHYTVPDVRQLDEHGNPKTTIGAAFFATFMCLVWLILMSYVMVTSLEYLAELMSIPDAVVGVTVSAAGKS